jgi:ParB-like chromosome segregation protein Spo0J
MSTCAFWSFGARLIEPQAVERLARSIERDGQIVPCVVVRASPDS